MKSLSLEIFVIVRKVTLLSRKRVYPFSYTDSSLKLNETALPDRAAFHNDLTDEPISDDDWKHVHEVWNEFKINGSGGKRKRSL